MILMFTVHVMWSLLPWHDTSTGCEQRRCTLDTEDSCEYIE